MRIGRLMILMGVVFVIGGLIWLAGEKMGLGRLPGEIVVRGERSTFYFPLATCLLLSVVLSLVLSLVQRWAR